MFVVVCVLQPISAALLSTLVDGCMAKVTSALYRQPEHLKVFNLNQTMQYCEFDKSNNYGKIRH